MDSLYPPIRRRSAGRAFTAALTALGGLAITLTLPPILLSVADSLSPITAARQCFFYPSLPSEPDPEELARLLLSASFFGSDALYFDLGDENTGMTELTQLSPSSGSSGVSPSDSLLPPDERDIYSYDYSTLESGRLALLPYDLSGANGGRILLSNTTSFDIEPSLYASQSLPTAAVTDEPLVLILHTHGTEAFAPEGDSSVASGTEFRSADTDENIVAVGRVMAEMLEAAGIGTIHCETMHDLESYRNSYSYSADTVAEILAEYPSIRYVFDVHRDAIVTSDGNIVRPICQINGQTTAQVMLLVGTNEKGADHPDWEQNLTLAVKLQQQLLERSEKLARPINIRGASFNQQATAGSLLIEIGSSGNTLKEAQAAAKELTYALIDLIKGESDQSA